jgi:hypothetical protein
MAIRSAEMVRLTLSLGAWVIQIIIPLVLPSNEPVREPVGRAPPEFRPILATRSAAGSAVLASVFHVTQGELQVLPINFALGNIDGRCVDWEPDAPEQPPRRTSGLRPDMLRQGAAEKQVCRAVKTSVATRCWRWDNIGTGCLGPGGARNRANRQHCQYCDSHSCCPSGVSA